MKHIGNVKASRETIKLIKSNKIQLDFCHLVERNLFSEYDKLQNVLQNSGFCDIEPGEWLGIWAIGKCVLPHVDDAQSDYTAVWFTQCTKQAWLLSTSTPIQSTSEIHVKSGDIFVFNSKVVHALVVEPRCTWALLVNDLRLNNNE